MFRSSKGQHLQHKNKIGEKMKKNENRDTCMTSEKRGSFLPASDTVFRRKERHNDEGDAGC